MKFTFRSYPAHPWIANWSIEPRDCSASYRSSSSGRFFRTQETPGRITANTDVPEWTLHMDLPNNCRINLLFNGFCAYQNRKNKRAGIEILSPEPGVVWGHFEGIPSPTLRSDLPITQEDRFQWLEIGDDLVLLAVQNQQFCLITKSHLRPEAERIAKQYLSEDFDAAILSEFQQRSGASALFEEMQHHDALAVISAESMFKALRPPEGSIPLHWCQASFSDHLMMDINEIPALTRAWTLIDPEMAEELMLCALKIQTSAGAIAVNYAPHTTHSTLEAPKPLLAQTAETVWSIRNNDDFLKAVIPLIRRHIQWLLHHFDPKRTGIHCWKHSAESLSPKLYESDLATVDLSTLLLCEIDALNRMRKASSIHASEAVFFETERTALENNLMNRFWNPQENAFTRAVLRDKEGTLRGFPAFTPLLWPDLSDTYKTHVIERVHESGKLPGGLSVLTWRKSAMDDDSFPLLQQLLVFQALKTADPNGQLLNDFSRITLQGFVEWHGLVIEQEKCLPINPVLGAFIMNVQAIRQYRYHAKGAITGYFFKMMRKVKADRFDLIVIAATLFAIVSVRLIYSVLNAPPPLEMLEAQMTSAYVERDIEGTLSSCMAIIKYFPDDADNAMLLAANLSILQEQYTEASALYEKVRKKYPDSPGAMIGLGLAYQLQGRFKEADQNYYEFCYIFEEVFPSLVDQINSFRQLMAEGFKAPPKWRDIYGYQLMHELE
ncbi:tetratricopeptide repeat protein [Pontiella agarivorans]|uniref:Tetratricopeptide repeat-containing protein n=1 Tax=Pontiella agarivorans TaxID=3038953 RepID=A0ABU5N1Y5_9BACT|nr:tetratricopeptide repeat protein [Pontiella agarivorans]MDZ8120459.1 hypothetical protein [Pontiella agarivorans]